VEISRSTSAVFEVAYHLVWCPKYRRTLPEGIQRDLQGLLRAICEARGWEVKALEVMPDHVHLFLGATPTDAPVVLVKTLKGITAKALFETHPELREVFRHGHLWSPSYYVGTVGHVSEETVARYVRDQKLRAPGRRSSPV
jgi:putative transposase